MTEATTSAPRSRLAAAFGVLIVLTTLWATIPDAAAGALAASASGGIIEQWTHWLLERQRELTGAMTHAVRRLKTDGFWSATGQLALVSFFYGVFHAAGPGHGKFVISSYALANARTLKRGILVSFMAALIQALSAIAIVGLVAVLLKATSIQVRQTEAWLETLSWAMIAALGAWLLYRSVKALLPSPIVAGGHHGHAHSHAHASASVPAHAHHGHHHAGHAHDHADGCSGHDHAHHQHGPHHHHAHAAGSGKAPAPQSHAAAQSHAEAHQHADGDACAECGHAHVASPADLQGAWSWREAWAIAFAVGVRPCTGALAVLIFALGIGLFGAGIFATFAMAVGTAITVSVLATLAVTSRDLAVRMSGQDSAIGRGLMAGAGVVGSALVMVMGTVLFLASLKGTGPL